MPFRRSALLVPGFLLACSSAPTFLLGDGAVADASRDADAALDGATDGAIDGPLDAGRDATADSSVDAPVDASRDSTTDAGTDAPTDRATDTPVDTTPLVDASDAGDARDSGVDVATDTGTDRRCGGRGTPPCFEGEYCDFPPSAICGRADGSGTCQTVPEVCTDIYLPVCGCDGTTYSNECQAHASGVSVETTGVCLAASCDAQDATGTGLCARFLGYYWDGTACVGLSGCSCEGTDCGAPFDSTEACEAVYARCLSADCRTTGCASGSSCMGCRGADGGVFVCIPEGAVC